MCGQNLLKNDEFERLQTFIEDTQDLFLLRQAKAEDGARIPLTDVELRLNSDAD